MCINTGDKKLQIKTEFQLDGERKSSKLIISLERKKTMENNMAKILYSNFVMTRTIKRKIQKQITKTNDYDETLEITSRG